MIIPYDRTRAVEYADRWALLRNPQYYDFSDIGGDCTNFASQCLYAGAPVMDNTPVFGWHYYSSYKRTPSWTGVDYFFNYLIRRTKTVGPFGEITKLEELKIGDFIQLANSFDDYFHTLVVVGFIDQKILVSSHSRDTYHVPLDFFVYDDLRCLHILGVRFD